MLLRLLRPYAQSLYLVHSVSPNPLSQSQSYRFLCMQSYHTIGRLICPILSCVHRPLPIKYSSRKLSPLIRLVLSFANLYYMPRPLVCLGLCLVLASVSPVICLQSCRLRIRHLICQSSHLPIVFSSAQSSHLPKVLSYAPFACYKQSCLAYRYSSYVYLQSSHMPRQSTHLPSPLVCPLSSHLPIVLSSILRLQPVDDPCDFIRRLFVAMNLAER